jgi:hypothetical protein
MEALVLTWGKARCCLWVSLEAWPEATSLAVVAAHTVRLTAMSKLSASITVFLHGLHVQGAIGGAVPRPVDDMEAHEKRFFEHLKYTPAGLSYGTKITNHRSHAASYSKMATSQDKIRQYFQLKKVITTTLF